MTGAQNTLRSVAHTHTGSDSKRAPICAQACSASLSEEDNVNEHYTRLSDTLSHTKERANKMTASFEESQVLNLMI